MVEKRWILKETPDAENKQLLVNELAKSLNIDAHLATLLWQRNVHNYDAAKAFFRPQLADLHDPFLMKDMDKAIDRLQTAIDNQENILIYGDYDVDGTTAVALVYGFLQQFYPKLQYYNPDRYKEGYGISKQSIDWAATESVSLIIALDCGIKANDNIKYAKDKYGIDYIICDHHEPGEVLPEAVAVLDPKRKDCPYPYKELTGNGVGFKLLTAWCIKTNRPLDLLFESLDLAMVSIASDIVPITGENRILAYYGLKKMNENPRTGLKALKEVAAFSGEMSIESVVFTLGPRINAAGRIYHAKAAVQLLLSQDYAEAVKFANDIQAHNNERKNFDSGITAEALAMVKNDQWMLNEAKSTVLFKEDWHKGVIGIVASRCIEHFYRPTVIFTGTKQNMAAGSARSIPGFDLYSAIESCSHLLEQFGGHMHAAGMTIAIENIAAFRQAFNQIVLERLRDEEMVPIINIDLQIKLSDISPKFYRIMKQMGPFGPLNMQPTFSTTSVRLAAEPKILKEKHLKLELLEESTGVTFTALGFNMVEPFYENLQTHKYFNVCYSLEEYTFRGQSSLQLFLKDLKFD